MSVDHVKPSHSGGPPPVPIKISCPDALTDYIHEGADPLFVIGAGVWDVKRTRMDPEGTAILPVALPDSILRPPSDPIKLWRGQTGITQFEGHA